MAQQFERLSLQTATHNKELQTMIRDLHELKGLRVDVNRMMEYMMDNERVNRNRREEVGLHMGDGGRVGRGIRVEPRIEDQEELNWYDDEFEEAFEYGNYHFDGRRFRPPRGRGVRAMTIGTQWLHSRIEIDGYEEYSATEYRSDGCSEEYKVIE
ncbi:hypothetical protein GH714_040301 [Hevea brasiliensis]|uniref:Uncharacterized protein n=1 Tax=Hevea brasiliensis TaxID=3981 RepID=A0A6A6MRA7_HEVBR|nr:hypothetical protein GH714_040301 [Hevea brasiliensis]